jgi:hypothetical protein
VSSKAVGGNGGDTSAAGFGFDNAGNGRNATAQATGIASQNVTISAVAQGGNGGNSDSGLLGGNGGSVSFSNGGHGPAVFGMSTGGGTVTVSATGVGGNGGNGGVGNGDGASVNLVSNGGAQDAVGGATTSTLNLTQTAIGGNGGTTGAFGLAGNASSTLIGVNPYGAQNYNLSADATGGAGGSNEDYLIAPAGGSATAIAAGSSSVDGGETSATSEATGGNGGEADLYPGGGGGATAKSVAQNRGIGGAANAAASAFGGSGGAGIDGASGGRPSGGDGNCDDIQRERFGGHDRKCRRWQRRFRRPGPRRGRRCRVSSNEMKIAPSSERIAAVSAKGRSSDIGRLQNRHAADRRRGRAHAGGVRRLRVDLRLRAIRRRRRDGAALLREPAARAALLKL